MTVYRSIGYVTAFTPLIKSGRVKCCGKTEEYPFTTDDPAIIAYLTRNIVRVFAGFELRDGRAINVKLLGTNEWRTWRAGCTAVHVDQQRDAECA